MALRGSSESQGSGEVMIFSIWKAVEGLLRAEKVLSTLSGPLNISGGEVKWAQGVTPPGGVSWRGTPRDQPAPQEQH